MQVENDLDCFRNNFKCNRLIINNKNGEETLNSALDEVILPYIRYT